MWPEELKRNNKQMTTRNVKIISPIGTIRAVLHRPESAVDHKNAVIMVAGAGGGTQGPSGVYPELANRLSQELGITVMRVDYRIPNDIEECVADVMAAVEDLKSEFNIEQFGIVGWSFGGAVVFESASRCSSIIGMAAIASQTYGATTAARKIGDKRSLLLIHGTGDSCLPSRCSKQLYETAPSNSTLRKELVLFSGDNHGCTNNHAPMLQKLYEWARFTLV